MERIIFPTEPDTYFSPKLYYASSISDMLESRMQPVEDLIKELSTQPSYIKRSIQLSQSMDRLLAWLLKKEPTPYTACGVYIPVVRHFPEADNSPRATQLTIKDPTAECEAHFPPRLVSKIYQQAGLNVPTEETKKLSWCSDVILWNIYATFQEKSYLIHIQNKLVGEEEKESIFDLMRRFAPVFLPNS